MPGITPELSQTLKESASPKQVLLMIKQENENARVRGRKSSYATALHKAESIRAGLIEALNEERAHDTRVEFNPIGMFNQIALRAPAEIIIRIAARQEIAAVILDEPSDAFGGETW